MKRAAKLFPPLSGHRPRIILADDHELVAMGVAKLIEDDFQLIGVVSNGRDLLEAVLEQRPDAAVVDLSMPVLNGVEAARRIRDAGSSTKIVFLSMHSQLDYVFEAFRAGASAYVLKLSAPKELKTAIHQALRGKLYIAPAIPTSIADVIAQLDEHPELLTSRQREVLQLIAEGHSAKATANLLGISAKTVEFHKAKIMEKLALRTTAELIRYALERGIATRETQAALTRPAN